MFCKTKPIAAQRNKAANPDAATHAEMTARLEALPRPPSIEERDDEELPEREGL